MYRYDRYDHTLVRQRVEQFRDQVERRLSGTLAEDEFKPLRLRNGLYLQRHAYMLRVAIPYGLLSADQLRMLAFIAREYDRGYGHFTTRQNIQYNWPELEDVPDILEHLALVEMHAIQTSGNCIRNITADHLAGVAADELEDPRPYCEILRQWSTLHPEFSWLPRKFKIAVTGATEDRAAVLLHDIGLRLVRNAYGEVGFRVYVGGGMGRTPVIGKLLREFLPRKHLLSYVEAVLRVYNLLGRRDNIHKARVKILVNAVGIDAFRDEVEREWRRIANDGLQLEEHDIAAMQRFFDPPAYERLAAGDTGVQQHLRSSSEFALWYKRNTSPHKVPGYRVVNVSLKAPGVPPGDATDVQMDAVADLAERYSFSRLRVTHEQNLVLADVKQSDLFALWHGLVAHELATPNIGTLNDMICCPGLDFCSLANAGSIPIAKQINERFDELDYLYDLGDIKLKMSGCMNACGHHHVGDIGILGVEKHGEEWYQITLGGAAGNHAALGDRLGRSVAKQHVAETIERVLDVYLDNRTETEQFADTYRRIGLRPFKEYVYADHSQPSNRRRRVAA
jgi:sulfite reductase (NADPH) hemoprotein beta-component